MDQDRNQPGSDESAADAFGPEGVNRSQEDESTQTQTLAAEALGQVPSGPGLSDTEKVGGGIEDIDTPDLVDHMNQMVTSGRIDMSAYRGERNDDDIDDYLGQQGREDD